ncbi:hypothetical protein OIO90_004754 [Microbotryomycetes sp. JL221]|nr:hypothetical protein OIO90_004754 [Microbotryomycetes sp. JL221]
MSAYSIARTSPVIEFGQSTWSSDDGHTPSPKSQPRRRDNNTTKSYRAHTDSNHQYNKWESHSTTTRPTIKSLRQFFNGGGHTGALTSSSTTSSSSKLGTNDINRGTVAAIKVQLDNSPILNKHDNDDNDTRQTYTKSPTPSLPTSPRPSSQHSSIKKKTSGLFRKRASTQTPASPDGRSTRQWNDEPDKDVTIPKLKQFVVHRPSVDAAFGMNDPTLPIRRKSFSKQTVDADRLHSPLPPVPSQFEEPNHHYDNERVGLGFARSASAGNVRRDYDNKQSQPLDRHANRISSDVKALSLPGALNSNVSIVDQTTECRHATKQRKHASLGAYSRPLSSVSARQNSDDLAWRRHSIQSSPVLDLSSTNELDDSQRSSTIVTTAGEPKSFSQSKMHGSSALAQYLQNTVTSASPFPTSAALTSGVGRPLSQIGPNGEQRSLRPIIIPAASIGSTNRLSAVSPTNHHRRTASAGNGSSVRTSQEIVGGSRSASPYTRRHSQTSMFGGNESTRSRPASYVVVPGNNLEPVISNLASTAPLRLSGSSSNLAIASASIVRNNQSTSQPKSIVDVEVTESNKSSPTPAQTPLSPDSVIDAYNFTPNFDKLSTRYSIMGPVMKTDTTPKSQVVVSDALQDVVLAIAAGEIVRRRSSTSAIVTNSRKQSIINNSTFVNDQHQDQNDSNSFEIDSFYELYEKDRKERRRSLKRQKTTSQIVSDELEAMLARPGEQTGNEDEWTRVKKHESEVEEEQRSINTFGGRLEHSNDQSLKSSPRDLDIQANGNVKDDEQEVAENTEGEETIKVSNYIAASPRQQVDEQDENDNDSNPSHAMEAYFNDSPLQQDVKFNDEYIEDDTLEILKDDHDRQTRSMTVDEMESEISRMEAELSLSGRQAELDQIYQQSLKRSNDNSTTTGSTSLQRSNSNGSTLSLGALTRKWSIVEMERAYERMRGMLGSTRSFCLSEMDDVDSGVEDDSFVDQALREDKLFGASNVALADANDEEIMALPTNRFMTPKPLDSSTFEAPSSVSRCRNAQEIVLDQPETRVQSQQRDQVQESNSSEVANPESISIREEPEVEQLPVSTDAPISPVKLTPIEHDPKIDEPVVTAPKVMTPEAQVVEHGQSTKAPVGQQQQDQISNVNQDEDITPNSFERKTSLASSIDPTSSITDSDARRTSSGEVSTALTNPTDVSIPTALSLKMYGQDQSNCIDGTNSQTSSTLSFVPNSDDVPTSPTSPRSSMQRHQRQRQEEMLRSKSSASPTMSATPKSPASQRASSRLSNGLLKSGAGKDLQRWLAGEPRDSSNEFIGFNSPTPSCSTTGGVGEGTATIASGTIRTSSRTTLRPLFMVSPDPSTLSDLDQNESRLLQSRKKQTLYKSSSIVGMGKSSNLIEPETNLNKLGGTWFPETPARVKVRRENLRYSLDPRDVFGGRTALTSTSARRDINDDDAIDPVMTKATHDVNERESTSKHKHTTLNMSNIRNMDKIEIFFKFTSVKADLEKAEMERDALFDALQESRTTLTDVRLQRDQFEHQIQEERKLYNHLTKYLGDDVEEQLDTLGEFVKGRNQCQLELSKIINQFEKIKIENDLLKRQLNDSKSRQDELERELIIVGAQVVSKLNGLTTDQATSTLPVSRNVLTFGGKRQQRGVSDEIDLGGGGFGSKLNEAQETPLIDQKMVFGGGGGKLSIDSVVSPLKGRNVSMSSSSVHEPVTTMQQQRDSILSTTSSCSSSGQEYLPPRPERDWNHVRHGSTASGMLKLKADDEEFLSDWSPATLLD